MKMISYKTLKKNKTLSQVIETTEEKPKKKER